MDLSSIEGVQLALRLAGLRAHHSLGQHFLVDRESLEAMLTAGELTAEDTVLEIGPGLGVMTETLAQRVKQVIAVEHDPPLAEMLRRRVSDNVTVVQDDIMQFDLWQLPAGYKVVANIPYYLTSGLIRRLLESDPQPRLLALLVQKEVAERIVAKPGGMSVLAFSVQYYGQPELLQVVSREKFWPPPKVDSAVLQVRVGRPAFEADTAKLFRLVKAGFGERRKMIKNSLAGGLNLTTEKAAELIERAGIALTARAQELSMADWERLYQAALKADLL